MGNPNDAPQRPPRHRALMVAGVVAGTAMLEMGMVGLDYTPATAAFPYQLLGWGVLGLPFIVGIAFGYAFLLRIVARRIAAWLAWVVLISLASWWFAAIGPQLTPEARLASVLGPEAAALATLEYLSIRDSFNDGMTYTGRVSGPPDMLRLAAAHSRIATPSQEVVWMFLQRFPMDGLSMEPVEVWSDRRVCLYYRAETGRLYFRKRTR